MTESMLVRTDMLALGQPYGKEGEAIRGAAADAARENLADTLAQPEYVGDIQTALIHHLRGDAFDWYLSDHMIPDFLKLERKIVAVGKKSDGPVPVVMSYQIINGAGDVSGGRPNFETTLVAVDADKPHFHSKTDHERDIREQGFAGSLAVTTRTISLIGSTARLQGLDLANHTSTGGAGAPRGLEALEYFGSLSTGDEFILHATKVTSGDNSVDPPDVNRQGASIEVDHFYNNQRPLVGWKAITKFVSGSILNTFEGAINDREHKGYSAAFRYMGSLAAFFEATGQLEALLENSPKRLSVLFEHAASFRGALEALKLAERPPDPDFDRW